MSNRQSNIIFYSIILLVLTAALINIYNPSFFETFTKSKEEQIIKKAMDTKDYHLAIEQYQVLINKNNNDLVYQAELNEQVANVYSLLGNIKERKSHLLKALQAKLKISKVDIFSLSKTYYYLGDIFEKEKDYDVAQQYFEKALVTRLGDVKKLDKDKDGLFVSMQQSRLLYLRENNEGTILIYQKLGNLHYIKKELALAKEYYQKALSASELTFKDTDTSVSDEIKANISLIEREIKTKSTIK